MPIWSRTMGISGESSCRLYCYVAVTTPSHYNKGCVVFFSLPCCLDRLFYLLSENTSYQRSGRCNADIRTYQCKFPFRAHLPKVTDGRIRTGFVFALQSQVELELTRTSSSSRTLQRSERLPSRDYYDRQTSSVVFEVCGYTDFKMSAPP
ncbi:hypothetical protein F2P81_023244 [Scophthalmus maximus]|uniref:Uncharacterized protein n=1 Tax=Scophthalmus maximus TaxID=52904 RepID=A0A6A4RZ36_SCOMX|nr:hypothetical protein F2P81_023244 [Scophthalmus maximus]